MAWTLSLDDERARDLLRSGGKGAGLAKLLGAGLPVPRGFVVLPDAMPSVLEADAVSPIVWSDAALRVEAARRGERLKDSPLSGELLAELRERLAWLGNVPVAVRSSSGDEDGAVRSAAGQHDTFLDVRGFDALVEALRDCWASVHGHRAAIYRARTGGAPFGARAAVVVQEMAATELAGVVFTAHPFDDRRARTLYVEAAPGSGAVVGGARAVDRYELVRRGAAAGRSADAPVEALSISRRLPAATPRLRDDDLLTLGALALRAERALGAPADLEWAWSAEKGFALLQLRPITPAARRGAAWGSAKARERVVWTKRFSGERWTEPATTLGWSVVEPALRRFTHWPWASRVYLRGTPPARLHRGIPYFNVTIFRHLLLKTPWSPTPEFILELFPQADREELLRRRWLFPNPGLVFLVLAEAVVRGLRRGHRFAWFSNPRDWARLEPQIEAAAFAELRGKTWPSPYPLPTGGGKAQVHAGFPRHARTFPPTLPLRAQREQVPAGSRPPVGRGSGGGRRESVDSRAGLEALDRLLGWLNRYVGVHVWSLLWANLFYQALGVFLERFGGVALHRLRPALVAGAGQANRTLRTNLAVWRLAAVARADADTSARILGASDGKGALAAIRESSDPAARRFERALDALLAEYGHRSRATWELFSPRWRDEPEVVMDMVRAFLRLGPSADPWVFEQARIEERAHAERELDRLTGWRRALVRWALRHSRTYSVLRENQRFVFDRLMFAIREVARGVGESLVRERRLTTSADVVHLTVSEMRDLSTGRLSAVEGARRCAVRRRETEAAAREWTPTFLFGIDAETREAAGAALRTGPVRAGRAAAPALRGVGISPGRYSGPARIARSQSDLANLRPGEVLVVVASDPGWTPYFSTAGGLVTELGGLLSHAAVVAREYGLPAVAEVADATRLFADGDPITVDGDDGLVWPERPVRR